MHRLTGLRALFLYALFAVYAAPPAVAFDDSAVTRFVYPDWFKPTFYDLGADLAEAEQAGKRGVALFFSTEGCSYCALMLRTAFADPVLAERLRSRFDVIGLEMFDDAEITDWQGESQPVKAFAKREGAQFSPTLAFYDARGRRLLRLVGYQEPARIAMALDYLDAGPPAGARFADWVGQRRYAKAAPPSASADLIADPLFGAPPYRLERSAREGFAPLLVIFEGSPCPNCERFHREVLADPEVRSLLQEFEVVRLDVRDATTPVVTPSGVATNPAAWYAALGLSQLPALAWFDERGRQVLEIDAVALAGRMKNALGYVRERAYTRGWTYQRYARAQALQRLRGADPPHDGR
jgi:thioredoxin-related protein